ncbi:MAG: 3-phosphoshikimate 1-carboxyvinyltransferase [Prevotella sp.]
MKYIITAPNKIETQINLPASKSISNRALVISAMTDSKILPENLSDCDDTEVIIKALKNMPETIDIKAAGTAMRFMTAFLSVSTGRHIITGTERMKQRPIRVLVDALRSLGADISYEGNEGYPPLRINGTYHNGGSVEISGNVSSQFISALLMIGPALKHGIELRLTGEIISRPYIDLTMCVMRDYGAEVDWINPSTIKVEPIPYKATPFFIENDWSAASYWYEIAALYSGDCCNICLKGLIDGSRQGDSAVKYLFSMLGIKTSFDVKSQGVPTNVRLKRTEMRPPRIDYDFVNQPDLAQTLVVTCAMMGVPFVFKGLSSLKIKETDRIEALKTEMKKLGYIIRETGVGELTWDGTRCTPDKDIVIDTYEDHRMAMAFAPVSLVTGSITINNPQVVSKSYPRFWSDLKESGFNIAETE